MKARHKRKLRRGNDAQIMWFKYVDQYISIVDKNHHTQHLIQCHKQENRLRNIVPRGKVGLWFGDLGSGFCKRIKPRKVINND